MRIRRIGAVLSSVVVASTFAVVPASAMTDNAQVDTDGLFPSVVALVYVRPSDGLVFPYCSGLMITAKVVLTASHCNEGTAEYATSKGYRLGATNDPAFDAPDTTGWVTATGIQNVSPGSGVLRNPLYKGGYRDDVSMQVLDTEMPGWAAKGTIGLPRVGLLDELQKAGTLKSTTVTVAGYGTEAKVTPANTSPSFPDSNERRYAALPTIAITKQWIHQDQNVGKNPDQAGACYGDSGGPSIMVDPSSGKPVVVGVTSTGDGPCFATNVASRVDTASALDFVYSVAPELEPKG